MRRAVVWSVIAAASAVLLPAAALGATSGQLVSTGWNDYGQTGQGVAINSIFKVGPVAGLPSVVSAANGYDQSLAALTSGEVEAWGENDYGEVGDGTKIERTTPVPVEGLSHVVSVAAGSEHSMALTSEGKVYAWGRDYYGEIGNGKSGSGSEVLRPYEIPELSNVVQIAAGCEDSFAVLEDGEVESWGYNEDGNLGDGGAANQDDPELIPGLTEVVSIAAGCDHALALLKNGEVLGWGYNDDSDVSSQEKTYYVEKPVKVGLSGVRAISAGDDFSVAVMDNGTVDAWGSNYYGEIDDELGDEVATPRQVAGLSTVKAVSSGDAYTIALLEDGAVYGFGFNGYGELGQGVPAQTPGAEQLAYPPGAVALASGDGDGYTSMVIEQPVGALSATSIAYGRQVAGSTSAPQSLTVTDNGLQPLSISADSLTGSGAGAFAKTADTCAGTTLAAGASCSISYRFAPSAPGSFTATLSISSDATNALPSVALGAVATARVPPALGALELSPSSFPASHSGPSASAAAASGTVIVYSDTQAATTTFTVFEHLKGIYSGGGRTRVCGKAPRHPRRGARSCTYVKTLGSFTHVDSEGTNALRFSGRADGHTLAVGSYTLSAVAASGEGSSAARSTVFKIIR